MENCRLILNFGIECFANASNYRYYVVSKVPPAPCKFGTRYYNSLELKDTQIFSVLPQTLRNLLKMEVEVFKSELDTILSMIQKEPTIRDVQSRVAESISYTKQTNGWDKGT